MARYHISRLGRLSSPDPIAGSTTNPQSLNRYSYSINDPANVTDPSGALVNCNTADARPKGNSQQASGNRPGGGPSDTDNSDADMSGADAEGDPPPQSGCGSHVNPWGGGGDWFGDWNAEFGIGGVGLVDGGFIGDASGLVNAYGEVGQTGSGLASTAYALSIVQFCGQQSDGPASGGSVEVNANCQDFITETSPMLVSLVDPAVTGARTAAAVQKALEALSNPDCASLFGNGVNPVALLTALASGKSSLGTISNADLGRAHKNDMTAAITTGILGPGGPTNFSGANITINNNPSSPFNAGWAGVTLFGPPALSTNYSDADLNAATIIHELGHVANDIYGPGSSAILWDQSSSVQASSGLSKINTLFVLKHCF
jgi:hypothetical protein